MDIVFSLCLPHDAASVPVVRHMCRNLLIDLGVRPGCVDDIELAATEACTNVLQHAESTHNEYKVELVIGDRHCEIRVFDTGPGFHESGQRVQADDAAESGRGIFLMRALVDKVDFVSVPNDGTIVHLRKELEISDQSVLRGLVTPSGTRR